MASADEPGRWGLKRTNTLGGLAQMVLDWGQPSSGLRSDGQAVRQIARSVAATAPAADLDAVIISTADRAAAWLTGLGPVLTQLTVMQLTEPRRGSTGRASLRALRTTPAPSEASSLASSPATIRSTSPAAAGDPPAGSKWRQTSTPLCALCS